MKHYLHIFVAALLLGAFTFSTASAKRVVAPQMYLFGFAASFNDTIVCFTDIQSTDSAWIDKKSGFLQSRDVMATQLREYLQNSKQMPFRTCVVFYNKDRAKLEKKYLKMKRLYGKDKQGREHYDVRQVMAGEFRFRPVDLTAEEAQAAQEEADYKVAVKEVKAKKKAAKAKQKADKAKQKAAKKTPKDSGK